MKKRNPRLLLAEVNAVHAMALGRKEIPSHVVEVTNIPLLRKLALPVRIVPRRW
jgi:hypothetical protein